MKICHLGYANTIHTHRWVNWLAERGHDTYLVSLSPYTEPHPKVKFITSKKQPTIDHPDKMTPSKIIKLIELYGFLKKFLKNNEIDIMHAHYLSDYGFFAAVVNHHPLINTIWGSDISEKRGIIRKEIIKYALKKSDITHIPEECTIKYISELGGDPSKTFIQPRGVKVDEFKPEAKSNDLRDQLGVKGQYSIINARSLLPTYNLDIFIRAIPYVIKQAPNVKFIILSGDKFMPGKGSMRKALEKLAIKLNVEDKIVWIGGVQHNEMAKYLASCDIYVDSIKASNKPGGGLGTTTMEAMACGLPLILAEKPYLQEYAEGLANEPWFNGLVYEPLNPKDMAEKIITLLKNEELRKQLGEKNRETALKIGDWDKNMLELEKLYFTLIEK